MKKLERIYLLDQILNDRRSGVSIEYLKERLECSQATVYRIIATLRDEFNAPVISDEHGVYYDRDAQFKLPGVRLSAEETQGLLNAAQLLEDLASDNLKKPIARIIGNIDKVLSDKGISNRRLIQIIPALSRSPDAHIFQAVMAALQQEKKIRICYVSRSSQQVTDRLISPQRMTSYKNGWYLDAWCHEREGIRLFALEQIDSATIDIERAKKISHDDLHAHYANSYGIFSGQARQLAHIKVNSELAPWVLHEHWHSEQETETLDPAHILIKIPYNDDRELLGDVMRLGEAAEIMEPAALRTKIKQQLQLSLAAYAQPPKTQEENP